jgi:hypothetical protein
MAHAVLTVGSDDVRDDMQVGMMCLHAVCRSTAHAPTKLLQDLFSLPNRSRFFRNEKSVVVPDSERFKKGNIQKIQLSSYLHKTSYLLFSSLYTILLTTLVSLTIPRGKQILKNSKGRASHGQER